MSLAASNSVSEGAIRRFFETQAHQQTLREYRGSIHFHLVEIEISNEPAVGQPVAQHTALRLSSLNSLYDVCVRLGWQSSTFSLAVHMLDAYASKQSIDRQHYRMVAFCCLWIASKYNENKPKGKLCDALLRRAGYESKDRKEFLATESHVLNKLGWDLSFPTTEAFLDLFLNSAEPNNTERRLGALFLCELAHFKPEIALNYEASAIAASAILVTNVAMLNLRHIRPHRFGELDTLLLKAVGSMPAAMHYRYLEGGPQPVVRNLVGLAASYAKERLAFRLGRTPQPAVPTLESFARALPMSPVASPTHQTSPVTPVLGGRHGRSHSAVSMLLPTPGTTPVALSAVTPLRPVPAYFEDRDVKRRKV